jgi:hypothetical protein
MSRLRPLLLAALFFPVTAFASPVITGELDGAPYAFMQPAKPGGDTLLVLAPGYRPLEGSRAASIDLDDAALRARHEAGWTLAATAYRRNGWVVRDGLADVVALIDHLNDTHGPFRQIFVQGESMGGLIVTRLVEDPALAPLVSGALALGAALGVDPARLTELGADPADLTLTHAPLRPILFVSNRNELAGPLAYVAAVATGDSHRLAAAHVVERLGHVNLTPAERLESLTRLAHWAAGEPPARLADVTVNPPVAPTAGTRTGDILHAPVRRLDPDVGNIDLDATRADLQSLGLEHGAPVVIRVADGTPITALIADRYAAVPRGEWVLVVLPDQRLRLALNMGNATTTLGVTPDSTLALGRASSQ